MSVAAYPVPDVFNVTVGVPSAPTTTSNVAPVPFCAVVLTTLVYVPAVLFESAAPLFVKVPTPLAAPFNVLRFISLSFST